MEFEENKLQISNDVDDDYQVNSNHIIYNEDLQQQWQIVNKYEQKYEDPQQNVITQEFSYNNIQLLDQELPGNDQNTLLKDVIKTTMNLQSLGSNIKKDDNKQDVEQPKLQLLEMKNTKKAEVLEIFFDKQSQKYIYSPEYQRFEGYLQIVKSINDLLKLLQESRDHYYFFYLAKPRNWWTFAMSLASTQQEKDNYSIEILSEMMTSVFNSVLDRQRKRPKLTHSFTKPEVSSFLNNQDIIKAFHHVAQQVKFLDDQFKTFLECIRMLVCVLETFNHKMKTQISYRLQLRTPIFFSNLFWNIQNLIQENECSGVNFKHITAIIDLYKSFDTQNQEVEFQWDYNFMILKIIEHLNTEIQENKKNGIFKLPKGLNVKDIFIYISLLKEIIRYAKVTPTKLQLQDMIGFRIHEFMLSVQQIFDQQQCPMTKQHYYGAQYIYQNLLEIADSCLLDQELIKDLVQSNDSQFLILLKQSMFDEDSPLYHSYYMKRESLKLYRELAKLAVVNSDIFECLNKEGFIDLSSINHADPYDLNAQQILREALKNLRKAESVNKILTQQVYASCA